MQSGRTAVLLIEDNPIHAKLIEKLLGQATGHAFDLTTEDCLQLGLTQLGKVHFDLVLLDLVLPDSQDLETFFRVRAEAPDIPIVILTATDDTTLAAKAVEEGAQAYLLKSQINSSVLERSIRYALQRKQAQAGEWDSSMFQIIQ